jgi:hypothetical protein
MLEMVELSERMLSTIVMNLGTMRKGSLTIPYRIHPLHVGQHI